MIITISKKLALASFIVFCILFGCRTTKQPIVGVWRPTLLVLSDSLEKEHISELMRMSFKTSKKIDYQFHPNGTLGFISHLDVPGIEKAPASYSVIGKQLTMDFGTHLERWEIITLTNVEMQVRSSQGMTIIYQKLSNK